MVADLSFQTPLVMANDGVGSYGRRRYGRCAFAALYSLQGVEHFAPLLQFP